VNPAELGEYRFRPELVHRRAALSTPGKISPRERVKPATVELRRNRTLTASDGIMIRNHCVRRNMFCGIIDDPTGTARSLPLPPICAQR
jgi:hypothetical protein